MNHWPAYIEVDLNQVRHNVKEIRRRIGPEVTLMLVVKVDAYGHGAPAVARAVLEAGAEQLGVACVDEAAALRVAGITCPILIVGLAFPKASVEIKPPRVRKCDAVNNEYGSRSGRLNDNSRIIVRRTTGYFCFLWYVVSLERRRHTCETLRKICTLERSPPTNKTSHLARFWQTLWTVRNSARRSSPPGWRGEEKTLLLRLLNAENEISSTMALENFILGFRLGMRTAMESLDEDDGSLTMYREER